MERKLAAILAVDVVGYSRLMRNDEEGTLASLIKVRDLIDRLAEEHGGRTFGVAGDSVLAQFASTLEAVRCGVKIQNKTAKINLNIPADDQMLLRIGVNLGDILDEGGTLYGDGINVAARLESLSEPGGMCVSAAVHDQVRDRIDLVFVDAGEQLVKNIDRPIRAYQVLIDQDQAGVKPEKNQKGRTYRFAAIAAIFLIAIAVGSGWWWSQQEFELDDPAKMALVLPDKPSIAVLPFTNMSNDKDQEYFSDGMTEDLITDLSKISGLTVISRTSTFAYKGKSPDIREVALALGVRYVVDGSIRKIGGKIRLTAQLIEAGTGKHLWAERYDRDFSDIFAMQDEVRGKIVSVLAVKLTSDEETRLARPLTNNPEAYDLYLRGTRLEGFFSKDSNVKSIAFYKQAIDLDSEFATAFARLAQAYSYAVENNWVEDHEKYIKLALDTANKAVELDRDLPYAHWSLARIHTRSFASDLEKAISHFEKSIELNPNYADGYIFLATTQIFAGHAEKALPLIEKGMRINPQPPFFYHQALGMARFFLGNYEASVQSFNQALEQSPTASFMQRFLIACYGYLDQPDDAEWAAIEYESLGHTVTIKTLMESSSLRDPVYRKIFEDGLRKGGLPEE